MKKPIILLILLLVCVLAFAGCKKEEPAPSNPVFTLDSKEDRVEITSEGSTRGSGGVGYLSFEEGEALYYNVNGDDSAEQLNVVIFYKEEPENPMSYTDPNGDNVYLGFTAASGTSGKIEMDPGEYALLIEVESASFTGTAVFEPAPEL